MRFPVFLFLFLFSYLSFFSQETMQYAREIIDTLCTPGMHGRGYVNKGDKIAAEYIKNEFRKSGLKPMGEDFFQSFSLPVNTFSHVSATIYQGDQEPCNCIGKTILPHSSSPGIKGTFDVVVFDTSVTGSEKKAAAFMKSNLSSAVVIIDSTGNRDKTKSYLFKEALKNPFRARALLISRIPDTINGNLRLRPWDVSVFTAPYPLIDIAKEDVARRKIKLDIQTKFYKKYPSQNIIAHIEGSQHPDSFIVFSAHYDHLGRIGKDIYFPGANDNASGVAMLLNLARHYSKPENKPACSMAFIAFGAEEAGLIGSKYFTDHPLIPLNKIKFLLNMDLMGTGDEGIMVVNGTVFKEEFETLSKINNDKNYLPQIKARGKAANSDHYFFTEAGVRSFFIYTLGGIKAYHDIYDRPETLPLTKFDQVFHLILDFIEKKSKN